jgi:hypothetical protein
MRLYARSAIGDIRTEDRLLDHLVGAQQEGFRQLEAERFGGVEIDVKLDFGYLLDR